jgi:hypothetical protein
MSYEETWEPGCWKCINGWVILKDQPKIRTVKVVCPVCQGTQRDPCPRAELGYPRIGEEWE